MGGGLQIPSFDCSFHTMHVPPWRCHSALICCLQEHLCVCRHYEGQWGAGVCSASFVFSTSLCCFLEGGKGCGNDPAVPGTIP